MSSVFDKFTNQYSLSKTLRFELKPAGETQRMLEREHVFEKDQLRYEKYKKTKPFLDRLHREFVDEALKDVKLANLEQYASSLSAYLKDKENKKDLVKKQREELRKQVVAYFDVLGKQWATEKYKSMGLKQKDLEILFQEKVFQILKERYDNDTDAQVINEKTGEVLSIFDDWKGFTGYFTKFFETRKNLYKSDGTATAFATRIIDQNLDRFLMNLSIYEKIKDKLDMSEVEKAFAIEADEVFSVNFYNKCLLQNGIDQYNAFLGGEMLENGQKLKGVNELVNKYRQDNTGEKLPFLKKLDKQILSKKEAFFVEITTDEEFKPVLEQFYTLSKAKIDTLRELICDFSTNTNAYDLKGVFLTKEALNTIFYKWTAESRLFQENLYNLLKQNKLVKGSGKTEDESHMFPDFVALSYIQDALEASDLVDVNLWQNRYYIQESSGESCFFDSACHTHWDEFIKILNAEFNDLFTQYDAASTPLKNLLENYTINPDAKVIIKNFADPILWIYQMAKYFALEKKRSWVVEYDVQLDERFYAEEKGYRAFYENAYTEIVQGYNTLRNYLTKKAYSEEKWKLNFDNPTLANGWDKNKETDNTAVILRKEGEYYLAVMKKGNNHIFDDKNVGLPDADEDCYEKLVYKLFPDPSKMMPKVCFSAKGIVFFNPSEEILSIYKNAEFKKGDSFSVQSMQRLIAFYIECLKKYDGWKYYTFNKVKSAGQYTGNIGEFFADVAESGYKIWFQPVSEQYIHAKNSAKELFLFKIYNKDFSKKSEGNKNLHTQYFEELFSQSNVDTNFQLKLNGQAELFFRPKSLNKIEETRKTNKPIIKQKRYTEDKLFFHVPMTFNRTAKDVFNFNTLINAFLAENPQVNIIGVDRGEKHLAYYSVINQQGKILDSGSLNVISGVDYHAKLSQKAEVRETARRDWQSVLGIKDLKKGYISQVVRKLADLAIKHNAIIVMEDLNMRFKQVRGGIEKSIYQQLEKALIEKLSFLVNKGEKDPEVAGHLLKAYQLAAPFESFQKMGKQTGIIFYTQAAYTSKIDTVTGWRPNLYLKYSNAKQAAEDIQKFTKIGYNTVEDHFEFTYDLKNFVKNAKEYPQKTEWTVCSKVERFRWDRKQNNNKGGYLHYKDLTQELKALFGNWNIDILGDIKQQITTIDAKVKENTPFFRDFLFYFGLICQIRNTQQDKEGNDNDFIQSPVAPFFDSRRSEDFGDSLPENGDDNGAYNIARKGIVILKKISDYKKQHGNVGKLGWNDVFTSNKDWDDFAARG